VALEQQQQQRSRLLMPTGGDAVPQRLCALETLHATGTGTMQKTKTSERWNWR
jgi:hypothetical protein